MQGFFKCTPAALLAGDLMKLEESYSRMMQTAGSNQGSTDGSVSTTEAQSMQPQSILMPEEARACQWPPPGVTANDIAKWGCDPDQLFLHVARNSYDGSIKTWQSISEFMPLEA
ncbi:uncharacterized protein N7482_006025 [Penicillium canariense]|uniref:Uncharacterized protein n=1 Tax=Penicillium canariense TaxID=189055 RepID=A0A9W9LMV0_9EURO|nr:uncharacterized protein N7482_006025 [Penicillium canariense]KAJ5167244.1 hypothetical protein N7482_006025 [Penicillium canariense]